MIVKILATLVGLMAGGWMVFDGLHVMVRGKYFGPEKPGPWSGLVERVGVDAMKMGPVFIALGILWFVCLMGLLYGWSWGWYGAVVVAIATLWYAPVGTGLSVIYIVLLVVGRTRLGM